MHAISHLQPPPSHPSRTLSLDEVHRSVSLSEPPHRLRRAFAYAGPALLIAVGYMDPGNWATDLDGGSRFGYQLLWVLLMCNLMALLLQSLCARLGIVAGLDLAQACREQYAGPVVYVLWALSEVAIIACDLAEVLGTAIALDLLFNIPLLIGVLITGFDVLFLLALQRYGIRKLEAAVLVLVFTCGVCFVIELFLVQPDWGQVAAGFVPRLNHESLYVAIGILGATVMPHNLYLHSALVQTRRIDQSDHGKREAIRYNLIDTAVSLNFAFLINAAILMVAAAVFFTRGIEINEIGQAQQLLTPLLGSGLASLVFAVALLCAGQSATLTGTLAGQIVMEGFLRVKLSPVMRRLLTRSLAIIPAIGVIIVFGDESTLQLLILSQVILSLQLPFAIVPLIRFTSDPGLMGRFVNTWLMKSAAWFIATVIMALNVLLIMQTVGGWMMHTNIGMSGGGAVVFLILAGVLGWIWFAPLRQANSSTPASQ
jgi:manganese transport protein